MGFNLFGPAKTSDIRVGYISTDRGYVEGVNICDANSYAKLNPGTTFIIKNRKRIEYKNINEVNKLTPQEAFVSAEEASECEGINLEKPYGPPTVEFFGGGGVGVKGNAVVGKDGGILGVHIVSGGNGYQYPPLVQIKDGGGNRGGGAVARSGLGQTSIIKEVYDAKDEFEVYFPPRIREICNEETSTNNVGYGRRYSPDGKDLGAWDPSMYVTSEKDPIKRQIAQFQEYLAALTDPWWFTRKEAPLRVTSDNEEGFVKIQKKLRIDSNRTVYPVQHWEWGGSLLKHGEVKQGSVHDLRDEIFEIYTEGGHGRGLQFTFTEVGGDHVFVVKADDYTDGGEPRSITKQIKPNVDYKVVSEGAHGIRNVKTGTEQGLLKKNFGSRGREKGLGTSSSIFADLIGTGNDNDDLQILAKKGKFKSANKTKRDGHSNYDLTYKMIVPATKGKVSSSQDAAANDIARSFMNDNAISPVPMSNAPGSDFAGMLFTMEWEEEFPYPGEYTFKGQCDNEASFYLDGQQEIAKIAKWKDKPTILKKNLTWEDDNKKGKVYKMRIDLLNTLQYKDLTLQEPPQEDSSDAPQYEEVSTAQAKFEGTKLDDIFLVVTGEGTANAEIVLNTNDRWNISGTAIQELKCGDIKLARTKNRKRETLTGTGKFVPGRYKVEIIGSSSTTGARIGDTKIELDDDAGNGFDVNASILLRVVSVDPAKRRIKAPAKPKPASTVAGIKVQKVFNTVDWMNKANRQLWRTNVVSRGGFINASGVCPFNTNLELDTNPYAGTHGIKWANVNFPIDGNYIIKAAVDDAVTLTFRGPSGETVIRKEGFSSPGDASTSTGTSTYTRFFKKGNYTLNADLDQIPGGRFGFRKDAKGKSIKDKEVSFKVTTIAGSGNSNYSNKITIPGVFSASIGSKTGSSLDHNLMKNIEVGKEYDVVLSSSHGTPQLKITSSGKKLKVDDGGRKDWGDIVCTVTEGQFYSIRGNKCKFKLDETIKGINPMVLAVDIEVAYATKTVVSARSWQENPMGVAFTIKAPLPPTPIEETPKQKGRCPNNPMWTTRFPANNNWYPVRSDYTDAAGVHKTWSKFLNRYAISPVLPLSTPGTDEGGKVFTNTWDVNIPYDGYYQLKGEVDDIAKYYIDGDLKLDLSRRKDKIRGASKFFLTSGLKKLRVEVENYSTVTYKDVSKKVFSVRDWRRTPPTAPPPAATGILCHAGGGKGGTDNSEQLVGGKVIVGKGGDGGNGGDDNEFDSHHGGKGGGAGLRSGGNAFNPLTHKQIDSMSAALYKGGPGGFGANFQGTAVGNIEQTLSSKGSSGGNGVAMGGGGGGNCRGGEGGSGGNGGVKIMWGLTGKSQTWTTPGVYNVTVPGNIGKAGTGGVPLTAKFEGTSKDNLELVVSGTGTAQCTIKLDTNDKWNVSGTALTELRCGSITLTRTKRQKRETITGTGTFVGGQRYPVQLIGSSATTGVRVGDTRVEMDDDAGNGFDVNASLTLSTMSEPARDGVTIICIGGGGSGYMDDDGDKQGSGGSGGAYAWVNEDIESGKKLKVIVGNGGKGTNVRGGLSGSDSYVELVSDPPPSDLKIIEQKKGKVSYKGPNLFHYTDKRWGKVMNKFGVSPANVDTDLDKPTSDNVGMKTLEWTNVDFPFKGQYDVLFAADNKASLYINGEQLLYADENYSLSSDKSYDKINIGAPGRYDVKIELINTYSQEGGSSNDDVFRSNPAGVVLEIRKDVSVATSKGKSWKENPIGISGVLVPPPCPKPVGGKGIVDVVIIDTCGTGFPVEDPPSDDPQYPVISVLKEVRVKEPGINYNCGTDKVVMIPDLGYKFGLECDPFGKIKKVTLTPPDPLPSLPIVPQIYISSPTGISCILVPVFDFIVPPPDVLPPEKIIQVTDLAGIKQTGYYNGKPYYGAIFYENDIKYAGWYATAGQPIQIYDTLQESIDATVTTPPSAIQRQGSDVSSNDPRLNIPGTPENLT